MKLSDELKIYGLLDLSRKAQELETSIKELEILNKLATAHNNRSTTFKMPHQAH